jgi:5-methyltetrahydrofolate--homocysteine methyltransferase
MSEANRLLDECARRILVLDGAMGTELQRTGLQAGDSGELWNLEHPDRVEAIHRAYVEAGSDAILTNTFGANPWVLGRYGLAERLHEINRTAAAVARTAVPADRFVLGDIGPFGGFLAPLGDVSVEAWREACRRQASALLEGGADGIIVETMSALEEAATAVEAAREVGAPVVVASMAFDRLPNGTMRTMMGLTPEKACRALVDAGADVVGANCGTKMAVDDFATLAAAFSAAVAAPIVIQPNAGQPHIEAGHIVYHLAPAAFAEAMRHVLAAGAAIVGGCCGTTPAHIAALAGLVRHATSTRAET